MKSFTPWLLILIAAVAVSPIVRPPAESKPADQSKTANEKADTKADAKADAKAAKTPPPAEQVCKPAEGKTVEPWCEPVRVISDFFGVMPIVALPKADIFGNIGKAVGRTGLRLRFLVALVPDPIDSYPPHSFDLALDAIQKGFGSAEYRPDRVWLPWELEAGKPQASADPLYRMTPGVLLFRGPDELAIVFLVGESPKTGIQKRAFSTALEIVDLLYGSAKEPQVSILGPTFSGSVDSLLIAMGLWRSQAHNALKFKMASGSATAKDMEDILKDFDFCRISIPDNEIRNRSLKFLEGTMGWELSRMALLTEADTAYGQNNQSQDKESQDKDSVRIGFPSRISDIRNAWEHDSKVNPVEEGKLKIGNARIVAGRPALDLGLEDRDRVVDQTPSFSFLTTPAKDLELSNLLQTISREGIRYVGILATDLKDKIFLIRKIRQYAPDTVVFTFDNSLLLAHPQYGQDMDGVVVISSAPLFTEGAPWLPRSQMVEGQGPSRQQFISEFQQGLFMASRYLLGKNNQVRPQIWISAVGNGSLWPIAHLQVPQVGFCGFRPARSFSRSELSGGDRWLAGKANLQMLVFAGILCLMSIVLRKSGVLRGKDGDQKVAVLPINRGLLVSGAAFLMVLTAVLLVVGFLPEWASIMSSWITDPWQASWFSSQRSLFLAALALVYGFMAFQFVRALNERWRSRIVILGAIIAVLFPLALMPILFVLWMPGGEIELFQLRARVLGSGLSPLVSLTVLVVALFVWILCELRRRWLVQRQSADCPLASLCEETSIGSCGELLDRLRPWLDGILPPERWPWILTAAILIPPFFLLWGTIQPITETKNYGRVFLVLLAVACFLALLSFLRFVTIWLYLRPVLQRMNYVSPELKKAFGDLAGEIEWQPMRSFAFRAPRFKMLHLSVQKLESLAAMGWVRDPGADVLLGKVFRSEAKGLSFDEKIFCRQLEEIFAKACEALKAQAGSPCAQEFLALRVVAYLRYVFGHLRDSLMGAIGTGMLILLAVAAYVFQPKQFVSMAIWVTLAIAVAVTFWIFLQMDRNPMLSLIGNTKPGEISLDKTFVANFTLYVLIPVLSMIATQFPEVGRLLGQMTNQLLRVAGGG